MKQLLLPFLLLPFYCHAQPEVGLNGGVIPYSTSAGSMTENGKTKAGYIYDIALSYRVHAVRLGLGYNSETLPVNAHYYNSTGPIGTANLYYANPLTNIYLFADHEAQFDHLFFNLGVNAGFAAIANSNYIEYPGPKSASGYSLGVHAGCSYNIFKGLCANIQAGITDVSVIPKDDGAHVGMLTFPLTVGVHYKLHWRRAKVAAEKK